MSPTRDMSSIDRLLDEAVEAINRGDRASAQALASQVLSVDDSNPDAEDLLAVDDDPGEIRRLTIMFADMVNSTELSTRVEPEVYHSVVRRYRDTVLAVVERFEGHIAYTKGDGLLAFFGHPIAHEDDVQRAVLAALEVARRVAALSKVVRRHHGFDIATRAGIHRGLVYLDTREDDVYGLGANLAARVSGLAPPNGVTVSDVVAQIVRGRFEMRDRPPVRVKGVDEPISYFVVTGERAASTDSPSLPIVGRDSELRRFHRHWAQARAGALDPPGLVIRGEAGIGKTRLALAAAAHAQQTGARVLQMHGSPLHRDSGLYPVRALLERRCAIVRSTPPKVRLRLLSAEVDARGLDPAEIVARLAPVLGLAPEYGYEPVHAEGRKLYELISEAVRRYLLACFGERPGLLVAEDAHWYDPTTIELVGSLLHTDTGRLPVVITGRPGPWLPDDWAVDVLDLKPLSDDEADTLILALDPTVRDDDRAAVRTRCDGVPFYIEQVMNALVTGSDREGARVPEALYEPLFARLRTCANAIPVVRAAGVIGRNIDRGLLRTACTLRDDEIEAVARELEKAGVFEPWREDGWRFRHELLREVAEELVPPTVRRTLHGRVADALAAGGDPDWSLVATHCQEAERYDDAAYAHQQASVAARRRGALAEARHHLALALENLERLPAGTERDRREVVVRLERGLLTAAAEFYSSESVAADFERCLALGSADLADDESVATLLSLVSYYATRADLRRMADVLRLLHERLGDGREWFGPAIEASLGVLYWLRGEFSSAGHYFDKVTTVRRGAVQPIEAVWYLPNEPVASAYLHQALTRLIRGDLAGAEEQLAESLRRSTELGFPQGPFMGGYSRYIEGWIHLEASRFHEAAALATALDGYAEQHGFDQWRLVAATVQAAARAGLAMSAENPDEVAGALDQMTGVLDLWRAVGLDIYLTFFDAVVARLLIAAGELDRARTYLDNALRVTERTEMRFYAAELLRLRARTQRDTVARRADLTTAYETADAQGATLIQLRVALDQFSDTGDADRVADVLRRIPVGSCLPELARARRVVYSPRTRS